MNPNRLDAATLRELAADAFDVLNWARRNGMNRQRQVDELTRTFEVRLGYRTPATGTPAIHPAEGAAATAARRPFAAPAQASERSERSAVSETTVRT